MALAQPVYRIPEEEDYALSKLDFTSNVSALHGRTLWGLLKLVARCFVPTNVFTK